MSYLFCSLGVKIGEEENAGKPELLLRKSRKKGDLSL